MVSRDYLQGLIDGISRAHRDRRSKTQLTLGCLIVALEAMPADTKVANLGKAHSYRGYYSDLAFELGSGTHRAEELLSNARLALDETYVGYKGGDFVMSADTPLWVASYGCTGQKLMAVHPNGKIETRDAEAELA